MDYNKADFHRRMLKNIVLNIELLFNDNDYDISEYDVQAFMSQFLRRNLRNIDFEIYRETFGKFDCSIAAITKNAGETVKLSNARRTKKEDVTPAILYELKTFLKTHEKLDAKIQYEKIINDFKKLSDGIKEYSGCEGYFLLLVKNSHVRELDSTLEFIKNRIVEEKLSKFWMTIPQHKGIYRIRPSTKVSIERVTALLWEIKNIKIT